MHDPEVVMPFYEYVCTRCGAATEMLQKLSDPPATTCPQCHAEALTKQISAAGFRLKGGGWYETDFKSDGQKNLVKDGAKDGEAAKPATAEAKDSHSCGAGCSHGAAKSEAKAESAPAAAPAASKPTTPPAATPST
jgi:putative FmdB family regulatory protein